MSFPTYPLPSNWLAIVSTYHAYAYGDPDSSIPYSFTGDISANTSGQWSALTWTDVRSKPAYSLLSDAAFQQEALAIMGSYLSTYNQMADHAQIAANGSSISGLTTSLSSLASAITTLQSAPPAHNHAATDITSGSKTAAFISDFSEAAQDAVAAALSAEFVYNDAGNAISMRALAISSPSLAVNTARQASSSRWAFVSVSVVVSATLSLLVGQEGVVTLEYADDSAFTTNVTTAQPSTSGNTAAVNISVTLTQKATATVCGFIPAGKYYRVKTTNVTGTPTYGTPSIQETLLTQGA